MWPLLRSLRWNCFCIPLIPACAAIITTILITIWLESARRDREADLLMHRLQTLACVLQDTAPHEYPSIIDKQQALQLSGFEALAVYAPTYSAHQTMQYPRIAGRRLVPLEDQENVHPCVTNTTAHRAQRGHEGWYGAVSFSASLGSMYVVAGLMHPSQTLWRISLFLILGIAVSGFLGAWYAYRHLYQPVECVLHQAHAAVEGRDLPLARYHSAETEGLSSAVHDLVQKYQSLASQSRDATQPPSIS